MKDAKHLENQHKEKLELLHLQLKALMEREKRIGNEQYNDIQYVYLHTYTFQKFIFKIKKYF